MNETTKRGVTKRRSARRKPAASSRVRDYFAIVIAAACALPILVAPAPPALADYVPGFGIWSEYHFSLDPKPIRVVFTHPKLGKGSFPDLVIPRAYVYFAHRAPSSRAGPLPPVVETDQIALRFVDGTGEAYSTALTARARKDGTDRRTAAEAMRAQVYDVTLFPTHNNNLAAVFRSNLEKYDKQAEPVEGLTHYRQKLTSYSYFVGEDGDEFRTTQCHNPLRPAYFCTYRLQIIAGVYTQISFVDFRLHGGRAEANRRLRFAREVVCRYLERC